MQMSFEIVLKFCRDRGFTKRISIMHVSYAAGLLTRNNFDPVLRNKYIK